MEKGRNCFRFIFLIFTGLIAISADAAALKGKVTDESSEPLIGATVTIPSAGITVATDIDGNYEIPGLRNGSYVVEASYVFYKTQFTTINIEGLTTMDFVMQAESQTLKEVVVTAQARRDSEGTIVNLQKNSLVVQSGVSAQQITRTQDSDASEVIKRVPGISLIDERFVMVRGLSQRYNNVWLNNSAVPSSEADSRAYSFDMIPSSQLDNMIIIKSPSPEYPADMWPCVVMTRGGTTTANCNAKAIICASTLRARSVSIMSRAMRHFPGMIPVVMTRPIWILCTCCAIILRFSASKALPVNMTSFSTNAMAGSFMLIGACEEPCNALPVSLPGSPPVVPLWHILFSDFCLTPV